MPLYMPELYEERVTRQMTSVFGGLNRGARIPDGEWADMQNLTSDQYPLMATRDKRHHSDNRCCPTAVTVRHYDEGECVIWLDGVFLRFGGKRTVNLFMYGLNEDDAPKQKLLNFGAYVIVYPAMIYVNTVDMEDVGRIEDNFEISGQEWIVSLSIVDSAGNLPMRRSYEEKEDETGNKPIRHTIPPKGSESNPLMAGELWYDFNPNNPALYQYDKEKNEWYKVQAYTQISLYKNGQMESIHWKASMREGDVVFVEGVDQLFRVPDTGFHIDGRHVLQQVISNEQTGDTYHFSIEGFAYEAFGSQYISKQTVTNPIKLNRVFPICDYMCESDNRLWGCRYGEDGHGNFVNEIYASARGDFFRWIQGAADNDDSPVTFSIGTDGPWTGCVNYGGAPTFFKERCMHRIGGYGASGFYVQDTPVRGVMSGASDSLVVVNGVLYYYADGAVMAYDGSLPVPVSEKLSPLWKYKRAVGGALYGKYYLSLYDKSSAMIDDGEGQKMRQHPSECALYVLDTERGLWHKEDDVEITCMATGEDDLVFVKVGKETVKNDSGVSYRQLTYTLSSIRGTAQLNHNGDLGANAVHDWSPEETKSIGWYATSGVIGLETPDKKYLSKISIRLCLSESDGASAWVEYDSEEGWKPVGNVPQTNRMRTVTLPIIPKRCDHMRLKLEGTGTCKVYSITKTFTEAEDE